MRGWNQYYAYVNATSIASSLTYWANDRFFGWLRKRHKRGVRWVERTYRHRERVGTHDRWNLGVKNERGELVYLYQLTDLHRRIYYPRQRPHPYLTDGLPVETLPVTPFPTTWDGHTTPAKADWAELRLVILERDGYRCTRCGSTTHLHIHHRHSRCQGGTDEMDNLETLCGDCHMRTTPWGRPRGTRNGQSRRAG